MILATPDDYDFPHIDWVCVNGDCGSVYKSSGKPNTDHCIEGHEAIWRPNEDMLKEYIEVLESMEEGDGIVVCGSGPAPLMGRVEAVGDAEIRTESMDSPPRVVRWSDLEDDRRIEWAKADAEYQSFDQVYHVGSVEVQG